jgi:protease I
MPNDRKVLMVIAPDNFRDEEYFEPRRILEAKGCAVTVASTTTRPAKGMLGALVTPDTTLDRVRAAEYDAVVFVGGYGAERLFRDPQAHALARDAAAEGKPLGAICVSPAILANAGVLKGKRATVWPDQSKALVAGGASYTAQPVEKDGRIITADGPQSAARFGEEIARALGL